MSAEMNYQRLNADNLKCIGYHAFSGCTKLADTQGFAILGDTLYAYTGPGGDVVIPEGVRVIEDEAFYGCNSIRNVSVPVSVTSLGRNVFGS